MYKAGHLLRRSSVRLKSLSKGHANLQMIISQLREVRSTFKAFVAAQVSLSEDLIRWSSTLENEAIHETFNCLGELNSLWTEAQKDFVDNVKHLRCNFDILLEGERLVDQAKQIYGSREETERNLRRELQKAYNKSSVEEVHLLRVRLSRAEKAKELAHLDVVDRVKENEAVRMIRIKDGVGRLGCSYVQMAHKASIIFNAQQKVASEIPDVHDKEIQAAKYKGSASAGHVEDAKEQLKCFSFSPIHKSPVYPDPPPPYSPSKENLNALSKDFSATSLNDDGQQRPESLYSLSYPSAPVSGQNGFSSPTRMNNGFSPGIFPTLPSPSDSNSPYGPFTFGMISSPIDWSQTSVETESESGSPVVSYGIDSENSSPSVPNRTGIETGSPGVPNGIGNGAGPPGLLTGVGNGSSGIQSRSNPCPDYEPVRIQRLRSTFPRKRDKKPEISTSSRDDSSSIHCPASSPETSFSSPTQPSPQNRISQESPPPYNPFYEWSEFPQKYT